MGAVNVRNYDAARATAMSVAGRIFTASELQDSGLATAIEALRSGSPDDVAVLAAEKAVQHYDDVAFAIREARESSGDTSGGQAYLDAFRKARAASAIKEVLVGNYERALYEAEHALPG